MLLLQKIHLICRIHVQILFTKREGFQIYLLFFLGHLGNISKCKFPIPYIRICQNIQQPAACLLDALSVFDAYKRFIYNFCTLGA